MTGYDDTNWLDDALCAQIDHDTFFPAIGGRTTPARAICALCTVKPECLEYALSNELDSFRFGIYGGTTPAERSAIYLDRKAAS